MPLIKKHISTSNTRFMSWLCCLPCCFLTSICVLFITCKPKAARSLCCYGFASGSIETSAENIARLSLLFKISDAGHEKLLALGSIILDPLNLSQAAIIPFEPKINLHNYIYQKIFTILDAYELGKIHSDDLSEEDETYIALKIRTAIYAKLPSPEEFNQKLSKALAIVDEHNEVLNLYLTSSIVKILTENFFITLFEEVSNELEIKRSAKSLIAARIKQDITQITDNSISTVPRLDHIVTLQS